MRRTLKPRLRTIREGRRTAALHTIEPSAATVWNEAETAIEHAIALGGAGRIDEAEQFAFAAARLPQASDLVRLRAAHLLVNLARFDSIKEIVGSISADETNPVWRAAVDHFAGVSAWAAGDLERAQQLLRSAVTNNPTNAWYVGRLIAFYVEYEQPEEARALLARTNRVDDPAVLEQYLAEYNFPDDSTT